jgi:hypothetical protein
MEDRRASVMRFESWKRGTLESQQHLLEPQYMSMFVKLTISLVLACL